MGGAVSLSYVHISFQVATTRSSLRTAPFRPSSLSLRACLFFCPTLLGAASLASLYSQFLLLPMYCLPTSLSISRRTRRFLPAAGANFLAVVSTFRAALRTVVLYSSMLGVRKIHRTRPCYLSQRCRGLARKSGAASLIRHHQAKPRNQVTDDDTQQSVRNSHHYVPVPSSPRVMPIYN